MANLVIEIFWAIVGLLLSLVAGMAEWLLPTAEVLPREDLAMIVGGFDRLNSALPIDDIWAYMVGYLSLWVILAGFRVAVWVWDRRRL